MKLVSWNVNGLRAVIKKDFFKILDELNTDILCIQETKMQEQDIDFLIFDKYNDYHYYRNSAIKKGYDENSLQILAPKYKGDNGIDSLNNIL